MTKVPPSAEGAGLVEAPDLGAESQQRPPLLAPVAIPLETGVAFDLPHRVVDRPLEDDDVARHARGEQQLAVDAPQPPATLCTPLDGDRDGYREFAASIAGGRGGVES